MKDSTTGTIRYTANQIQLLFFTARSTVFTATSPETNAASVPVAVVSHEICMPVFTASQISTTPLAKIIGMESKKENSAASEAFTPKNFITEIVAPLRELLPETGFIAEEGSGSLTTEVYCWLVSPLDGTPHVSHNNAPYWFSIVLCSKEVLLVGMVYYVCRDVLY